MKIGLVIYGSLDTHSGEQIYDRMVVSRLREEGSEIEIIALPWQSNYVLRLANNLAEEIFERLRDTHFDLLLQDEACHPSLFRLNQRLRNHVKYPIVAIVHRLHSGKTRSAWQNRFYREVERRYLESVDSFVFASQTIKSMVEGIIKGKRPAVVAYPAGDRLGQAITPDRIAVRAAESGPLRVLFIGNLIPHTGLHILLDALEQLTSSSWHLTIAGSAAVDRQYAQSIANRLQQCCLLKQTTHSGPLDGARLILRYASSHVLVTPSSFEGSGLPYLEGMSFGLPTIAGKAGAICEIVTHGLDGFLIPCGDADALTGYLQTLIDDRDKLLDMSLAARSRFDSHPSWAESTGLIHQFLQTYSM